MRPLATFEPQWSALTATRCKPPTVAGWPPNNRVKATVRPVTPLAVASVAPGLWRAPFYRSDFELTNPTATGAPKVLPRGSPEGAAVGA
jgi:hypothetical protein